MVQFHKRKFSLAQIQLGICFLSAISACFSCVVANTVTVQLLQSPSTHPINTGLQLQGTSAYPKASLP